MAMGKDHKEEMSLAHKQDSFQDGDAVKEAINSVHSNSPCHDVRLGLGHDCATSERECVESSGELKLLIGVQAHQDQVPILDSDVEDAMSVEEKDEDGEGEGKEQEKTDSTKDKSYLLQDHGWAWFVCLGCFFSHCVIGGFERSDGVIFLELTNKFQKGAQLTAWPGAICSSTRLVMGPLASAMCNRFSVRATVMAGTLIFAVGVIFVGLAPNIFFIFFSYGIVQGIGRGLVYAPGLIIVGLYFNRYRGLGVGLGTAGVGVGTFFFPPTVEWLFQEFSFQGAFLILGAVALNGCVVAALFRPFYVHRNIILGRRMGEENSATALRWKAQDSVVKAQEKDNPDVEIINTVRLIPQAESTGKTHKCDVESTRTRQVCHKKSSRRKRAGCVDCVGDVFHTCFPTEEQRKDLPQRKLIEWSLLKIPSFLFYCLSICLFTAAFKSAFTFLPAMALSTGLSATRSAYLLSISGICDTIGRIMAGFILDVKQIKPFRPVIYNSVVLIITVLSFITPFLTTFTEFAVMFGFYGMLTGTYVSQKSVILVDLLGPDKLSSSFGLMICFQGIGTLFGPPLSGLLKDEFGRFDELFYFGGGLMAVAGLLMIVSNVYRVVQARHASQTKAKAQQ